MPEEEGVALDQGRLDVVLVDPALQMVRRQDHDQVGLFGRLARGEHPQALGLGLLAALGALEQADADVDAGVAQAQGVRVTLAAVSDHCHVTALDDAQVGGVVIEHFSHLRCAFLYWIHHARLHEFLDTERLEHPDKGVQLVLAPGRLDSDGIGSDVDDLGPEELYGLQDLRPGLGVGAHLDQEQLALH